MNLLYKLIIKPVRRKSKKTQVPPPHFVHIQVNEECFFKCKMCFKWKPDLINPESIGIITTDDIKKFLRELRQLVKPGFIYSIAGGEIFLRKDLIEIFNYSKKIGLVPQINTNGWLVNKELARNIVLSGVGIVNFSVDGSNKEVHDEIRGIKKMDAFF